MLTGVDSRSRLQDFEKASSQVIAGTAIDSNRGITELFLRQLA